jgi:TetR/AcrR family transcriptional repressor of nem operon
MSAPNTKERILDAAKEIMLRKSFHSVGLNEILASVKVPKGSFYHYFASKEQFGAELLQHYVEQHSTRLRHILLGNDLDPLQRLIVYIEGAAALMLEGQCTQVCLVAKLGAEVSTLSEPMREVLARGIHDWHAIFERVVREGQESGVIRNDIAPGVAASMVQDLWQGAMHRSQIEKSACAIRDAAEFVRQNLAA